MTKAFPSREENIRGFTVIIFMLQVRGYGSAEVCFRAMGKESCRDIELQGKPVSAEHAKDWDWLKLNLGTMTIGELKLRISQEGAVEK